jgi:hypothetical protein
VRAWRMTWAVRSQARLLLEDMKRQGVPANESTFRTILRRTMNNR